MSLGFAPNHRSGLRGQNIRQVRAGAVGWPADGKYAVLFIDLLEHFRVSHFRSAKEKKSVVAARVPEHGHCLFLQLAIEIDQQVATRNEMQP